MEPLCSLTGTGTIQSLKFMYVDTCKEIFEGISIEIYAIAKV